MFKNSHLDISNFDFFSFCPFRTEKYFAILILSLTPKLHHSQINMVLVLESGVKLALSLGFFVQNEIK
jgi:hypothetical protein